MVSTEPTGPYMLQAYGVQDKEHWASGRIFAVVCIGDLTVIKGLTREEALGILDIIKASRG